MAAPEARRSPPRPARPRLRPVTAARRGGPAIVPPQRLLIGVVLILLALGIVMVLSASSVSSYDDTGNSFAMFNRQAVWVGAGLAAMLVVARVDYRRWRRLSAALLLLTFVLLVWVLVAPGGRTVNGATSWIQVTGALRVQPSELAKLALLLFAADVLARKERLLGDVRHALVPVLPVMLLLTGLIILQPDLGTAVLVFALGFGLLFVAGAPLFALAVISLGGIGAGLLVAFSADYRQARILSFLDPGADPLGTGWQVIQGQLALGSGGLFGVGLGRSLQKWGNVPFAHTDFIFAIIGEELGLLGTLGVITLFVLFAYAGVRVAWAAPDRFGRYLGAGITIWVSVTALVNLGAVVGLLPITGVPLPLVSFGGFNLVVLLFAIGVLLNVAKQGQRANGVRPLLAAVTAASGARRAPVRRTRTQTAAAAPARAGGGRGGGSAKAGGTRGGGTRGQHAASPPERRGSARGNGRKHAATERSAERSTGRRRETGRSGDRPTTRERSPR